MENEKRDGRGSLMKVGKYDFVKEYKGSDFRHKEFKKNKKLKLEREKLRKQAEMKPMSVADLDNQLDGYIEREFGWKNKGGRPKGSKNVEKKFEVILPEDWDMRDIRTQIYSYLEFVADIHGLKSGWQVMKLCGFNNEKNRWYWYALKNCNKDYTSFSVQQLSMIAKNVGIPFILF
jgi:hypothetical protein